MSQNPHLQINNKNLPKTGINIQDTKFGVPYIFQPNFLQILAHRYSILIFLSIAFVLQQAISNGFPSVIYRTLEIRFQLTSVESGILSTCYEISDTVIGIFVIHWIQKWHKPQCIGFGLFFAGIGSVIFCLPHFISAPYSVEKGQEIASGNLTETAASNQDTFWQNYNLTCPAAKDLDAACQLADQ